MSECRTHTVELRELPVALVQIRREPLLDLFLGCVLRPQDTQLAPLVLGTVANLWDVGLEGVDSAALLIQGKVPTPTAHNPTDNRKGGMTMIYRMQTTVE